MLVYQRVIKTGHWKSPVFSWENRPNISAQHLHLQPSEVKNVEIKKQPDGTSRGFAFVTFAEKVGERAFYGPEGDYRERCIYV